LKSAISEIQDCVKLESGDSKILYIPLSYQTKV